MFVRDLQRFNDLAWGPWAELQEDLDRLFFGERAGEPAAAGYPAINVWTREDGAVVTATVAGIDPAHIELDVDGRQLTIAVNRPLPESERGQALRRNEILHGRFARAVTLPFEPDGERIDARLKDGVLAVLVPRTESDRPRRIAVQGTH